MRLLCGSGLLGGLSRHCWRFHRGCTTLSMSLRVLLACLLLQLELLLLLLLLEKLLLLELLLLELALLAPLREQMLPPTTQGCRHQASHGLHGEQGTGERAHVMDPWNSGRSTAPKSLEALRRRSALAALRAEHKHKQRQKGSMQNVANKKTAPTGTLLGHLHSDGGCRATVGACTISHGPTWVVQHASLLSLTLK